MPWKNEAVLKRRDVFEIDPRKIEVQDGWNPRTDFSGEEELKLSIIENGVLEPITVKAIGERVILVDGERRLRATLLAVSEGHQIVSVPAMLARRGISDVEAMFTALIKNDGKPLSPVEEADAFRRLAAWGVTQADIAKRIGRSQPYVSGRLVLVDAAPEVRQAVLFISIGNQHREFPGRNCFDEREGKMKVGELCVWWIPQVPGKPFEVPVESVVEGVKIMTTLAHYDIFQFENKIKPDYCNVGGLWQWSNDSDGEGTPGWEDWYDDETGEDDPEKWLKNQNEVQP